MQAERGSADLNFNFTLKQSAAKAAWTKAIGLLSLIPIVSVPCSLSARWVPAAITPAPAAAGFGATPEA